MTIKSLDQSEKGYIAGVLDSDGAILIRRIGKTYSFYCYIMFVGTFEQMYKVKDMLRLDNKVAQHGNRWKVHITSQEDVVSLLKRIYPFLTKKPEANLVFQMRALHDKRRSAGRSGIVPSDENVNRRIEIFKQYKMYKARSGGHITNWDEFEESLTEAWSASHGNHEPSQDIRELFDQLSSEEKSEFLHSLEGVTTSPEITGSSVPLEREDIV